MNFEKLICPLFNYSIYCRDTTYLLGYSRPWVRGGKWKQANNKSRQWSLGTRLPSLFVCFFVFCFGEHLLIFVRRPSHLFPFSERMVEAALLFKKRIGEKLIHHRSLMQLTMHNFFCATKSTACDCLSFSWRRASRYLIYYYE